MNVFVGKIGWDMLCICALLMQDYSLESFSCSLDDMGRLSTVGHPPGTPQFFICAL